MALTPDTWTLVIMQFFDMFFTQKLSSKISGLFGVTPSSGTNSTEGKATTKEADDDGKGTADEHHYLIGLAEAHFGKPFSQFTPDERRLTETQRKNLTRIYELLREEGKSGGAEKLMHIIGKESHLHTRREPSPSGSTHTSKPGPTGAPAPEEVFGAIPERSNPAGQLIMLFLASIEPAEAVKILNAASISDTAKDKFAAAGKATQDKGAEILENAKTWLREHETELHSSLAGFCVPTIPVEQPDGSILEVDFVAYVSSTPHGQSLIQAIEAAPDEETRREKMEDFQRHLLTVVDACQEPAARREFERLRYGSTGEERQKRNSRWIKLTLIGLSLIFVIILIIEHRPVAG